MLSWIRAVVFAAAVLFILGALGWCDYYCEQRGQAEPIRQSHRCGPARHELIGWQQVRASWFDDSVGCRANVLDPHGLHFAHRELPFGSMLQVRANGVTIEPVKLDHGPHPETGLCWDLSLGCWEALGIDTAQGHAWVCVREM